MIGAGTPSASRPPPSAIQGRPAGAETLQQDRSPVRTRRRRPAPSTSFALGPTLPPRSTAPSFEGLEALLFAAGDDASDRRRVDAAFDELLRDDALSRGVRELLDAARARWRERPAARAGDAELDAVRALLRSARRRQDLRDVVSSSAPFAAAPTPPMSEDDTGLLADFVAESRTLVRAAAAALATREAGPHDVNAALRAFHTIKGTSSMLGREHVTRLSHAAEGVLTRVRDQACELAPEVVSLLLRACQQLDDFLDGLQTDPDASPAGSDDVDGLLRELEARRTDTGSSGIRAGPSAERAVDPFQLAPRNSPHLSPLLGARAPDATTRVQTDRLDEVARLVDALGRTLDRAAESGPEARWSDAARVIAELQHATAAVRRVPIRGPLHRVRRVVREVSAQTGKAVAFVVTGDEHEVDCGVAEVIGEALVHLARNAVDHGLESAEQRRMARKPEEGTIRLTASRAGDDLVIEVADDGRGLERTRLLSTAIARGLVAPATAARQSDADVWRLVFAPGLSTAREVTELSGRGVGLDIVRQSCESLGGAVDVTSRPGAGTTFTLRLPVTDGRAAKPRSG